MSGGDVKMDIKIGWKEIREFLRLDTKEEKKDGKKTSLGIFDGGLHVHFHISINPTFMHREKDEQ